jgi:putative ABC transport system permease protein
MIRTLRRGWNRLRGTLFHRSGGDAELAEELQSHIQLLADENMRRGMPPEEAYRRAKLQFGSIESTKESYRSQRGLPAFEMISQDLRYAMRGIRRSPGFAVTAILSLAIGIGANTAIFSLVDSVLLRPLDYRDPRRIFAVGELLPHLFGENPVPVNPAHASAWARECPSIDQIALMSGNRADVDAGGEPASFPAADVAHNVFAILGVKPILGRTFLPEEEQQGRHNVVILSESLWRSRFNADRGLIGKSILIDRENYQVVGVVPASFRLPYGFASATNVHFELYRPLVLGRNELARMMGNFNYAAILRLNQRRTASEALAEMNVVEAQFPRLAGSTDKELKAKLIPLHEFVTGRSRLGFWMLTAAVGAVLLIVCINLANLLLARITSRSREAAIRSALGASRGRQFGMVLTESLLLAGLGGALGIVFADWGVHLLISTTTLDIPRLDQASLDPTVLVFALCLTALTGFVFGVLPAWRLSRNDPQEALRSGSHTITEGSRGLRLREALIALEVGVSAVLLIVAGLLTASLSRLLDVDKGFDAGHVLTVDIGLSGDSYMDAANREKFFDRLLANVTAIPRVQSAGVITALPTRGQTWNDPIYLEGAGDRAEQRHPVDNRYASPGYFRTMSIPVVSGRGFEERDRGHGVAVLSEKAAQLLWPGDPNPVGRRFVGEDDKLKTLVGVVKEVRAVLDRNPPPMAYYPYWQRPPDGVALVVRTTAGPQITADLRAALHSEDPQLPIQRIRSMEDVVNGSTAQRRFQLVLMAAFALSALLVASLGIYGVVSYSVARRRNEIGIRMALGAQRSELLLLLIRQGMTPVVLGLTAGVVAAIFLSRAIRGLLFEVQPTNFLTIAGVVVVLLTVGIVACFLPGRRAASTDAVAALRFE